MADGVVKKEKRWSSAKADKLFSAFIRKRDGRCLFCHRHDALQCSHYVTRSHSTTRYDPQNCDAICPKCHWQYERRKQFEYKDKKLLQMGFPLYEGLVERSKKFVKRRHAIEAFKLWYEKLP